MFILPKNPPCRRRPLGKYPRKVLRGSSPLLPVSLGLRCPQCLLVFPKVVHVQKRNIVLPPPKTPSRRTCKPCAQGACYHSLVARSAAAAIPCRWGLSACRGGFELAVSASSRPCARVAVALCSGWHLPSSIHRARPLCSLHLRRHRLQLRPLLPFPLPPRGRGRLRRYQFYGALSVGGGAPSLLALHCHSPRLFVFSWRFTVTSRGGAVWLMLGLPWMVDRCSSTCWGASARVGFVLIFLFAYSSPTASDVGGALFMNHVDMVPASAADSL